MSAPEPPRIRLCRPTMDDETCRAVEAVLRGGLLTQGAEVRALEAELAHRAGARHAVAVSSGTAALHAALMAADLGPGDAVLVPDFTFAASANVVERVGATTVLVDVRPARYDIDPQAVERTLDAWDAPARPRAIMPVHEFGGPADMTRIMALAARHDLIVIEDAACAIGTQHRGRPVGTFGRFGCLSFHPRKTVTTGEGGAVLTEDGAAADRLRALRNHGLQWTDAGPDIPEPGLNYRMTDFQAAIGRVQLRRLEPCLDARRHLQAVYRQRLADTEVTCPADVPGHTWQTFMVVLPDRVDRDAVIAYCRQRGVETTFGAYALHTLSYYRRRYARQAAACAGNVAERLFRHGLALPLHPGLSEADVERAAAVLRDGLDAAV